MTVGNDEIPGLSKQSIILQVFFWLLFIPYEIGLAKILGMSDSLMSYLLHYMLYLALFYWHSYGLFLRYIRAKGVHIVPLALGLLAELVLFYLLVCVIRIILDKNTIQDWRVFYSLPSIAAVLYRFGYMVGLATTFWLGLFSAQQLKNIHTMEKHKLQDELQKENLKVALLQSEMAFLKAQIQPHFLLNVLNKIYGQLKEDSPAGAATIMQLARLMQHQMIAEPARQYLPLSAEIKFLQNYLILQRAIRPLYLIFNISGSSIAEASKMQFPSFILVTILENMLKYAQLDDENHPAFFSITLKRGRLLLLVKNKINTHVTGGTGIGLANIKKRLALLYPALYRLTSYIVEDRYYLKLYVILNKNL
ncbi:sensor histidine kinase [Pedobacter glucosidilyticus]|uniref:sensor histidine kinase n=1 Tax=Pedobacter glucosidilyticus TaxID=1122941 RepID=UPI000404FBB1|nr:sensor histidine kinase [Pedobacter glucosidilyticus]